MAEPQDSVVEKAPASTTAPSPAIEQYRRSVFVIHMAPLTGKLTPLARKLHIAMGRMAGEQFKRLDEQERAEIDRRLRLFIADLRAGTKPTKPPMLLQPRFSASLRELAEAVGYEPSEGRHLMGHLSLLENCSVEYNSVRYPTAEVEKELYPDELQVTSKLLSSVVRTGRGLVSWAFDPVVLAIMVMPRTYAYLNMDVIRGVRSYAALALYENCKRFVGNGLTGVWSSEQWRRLLSPTGQVPEWRNNERELTRTIKAALEDLRACDAVDIDLVPVKVRLPNNKPGLQFKVKLLEQARLPFGEPVPADKDLQKRLMALGFKAAEVRHMVESRDETYLRAKLELLHKAKNVQNPRAWLSSALARDFKDEERQAEQDTQRHQENAARLKDAEELQQAFAAWQHKRLRERFDELLEDERASWERRFAESSSVAAALTGKAKQGAFFGWLLKNQVNLLDAADTNALLFAAMRPDKARSGNMDPLSQ